MHVLYEPQELIKKSNSALEKKKAFLFFFHDESPSLLGFH